MLPLQVMLTSLESVLICSQLMLPLNSGKSVVYSLNEKVLIVTVKVHSALSSSRVEY